MVAQLHSCSALHEAAPGFAVQVAQSDKADTPATVVVFTGGLGDGAQDPVIQAYHAPIWRIDDGPVYGVPWEMCEIARQYSEGIVARGFPESWPSDLVCANETYRTQTTYSRVEYLSSGEHTLYHGVVTWSSQVISTWKKGWIKIDGAVVK